MSGRIINKRKKSFTVIPNEIIRAKDLTWKAKGLMVYLLSLNEEWTVHKSDLSNRSIDGYDSMISGWNELEKAGYIETIRIKENNLFKGYEYIIHDSRVRDFTEQGFPEQENPQLINNSLKEIPLLVDSKLSNAELTSSTTAVSLSDMEKCRLFVKKFNEIKTVNGKNGEYQPIQKVCGSLKQRLKNYKTSDIFRALKIAMADDYHIKTKFKYITPEYILRANILERFLNTDECGEELPEQKRELVY